jgi:hypothetical protein
MKHLRVDAVIASDNLARFNAVSLLQLAAKRFAVDNHPGRSMKRHPIQPAITRWNQIELTSQIRNRDYSRGAKGDGDSEYVHAVIESLHKTYAVVANVLPQTESFPHGVRAHQRS